ncbi:MAG: hypothetical protein Q4Q07_10080 [Tissierellia bacterium]|nr:hypothetical protein [Tissierellia bacterium]
MELNSKEEIATGLYAISIVAKKYAKELLKKKGDEDGRVEKEATRSTCDCGKNGKCKAN